MDHFVHTWQRDGRLVTSSWVGEVDAEIARVHALAFTPDDQMLLVGGRPQDPGYWLPGGGVEAGETTEAALARELMEEAAATLLDLKYLGAQRIDDAVSGSEYHALYWCRVTLADEFTPELDVPRHTVSPDDFLDTLYWGRNNPMAAFLLDRALEIERAYRARQAQ